MAISVISQENILMSFITISVLQHQILHSDFLRKKGSNCPQYSPMNESHMVQFDC